MRVHPKTVTRIGAVIKNRFWLIVLAAAGLPLLAGSGLNGAPAAQGGPPLYGYRIVNVFPHDRQAFTQGLVFHDGFLFESTGRKGLSTLRKVRLETGEVLQEQPIDDRYFAEGLAAWNGRLLQLTWKSRVGFVYDLSSLKLQNSFHYSGEGWGLTHDGTRLIMSDGSATLRVLDPQSFREQGRIPVRDGQAPVPRINELEYVRGEIYANIWRSNRIARISPESGRVIGWIDLTGLLSPSDQVDDPEAVLNGIAFDAENDRLFVTGKLWPRLFEIELIRR